MSDGTSFTHLGVCVGTDGRVICHAYADDAPILAVNAGRAALTISVEGRKATDAGVKFARELAKQAARFAAEVERLHAAQHAKPGTCPGCGGAVEGSAA